MNRFQTRICGTCQGYRSVAVFKSVRRGRISIVVEDREVCQTCGGTGHLPNGGDNA